MLNILLRDWLLDPLGLLLVWTLVLLALTVWRVRRSRGRSSFVPTVLSGLAWWIGVAAISAPAIVNPLIAAHENRVPVIDCDADLPIVVLAGGTDSRVRDASRFEAMSSATLARVAEAARLSAVGPAVPIILTGGAWHADRGAIAEADVMADLLERLGVPPGRIVRETRSTSTADNARRVAALDVLAAGTAVRLVTSALHMPRAAAAFTASGVPVCAVPVDRLAVDVHWWSLWPQTSALQKFDRWLHEQLGFAIYRMRGDA